MRLSLLSRGVVAVAAVVLTAVLGACGTESTPSAVSSTAASTSARPALVVKDPWVKTAKSGMSAAFATLLNTTDKDIVIVAAACAASPKLELHETTMVNGEMAMRPKEGGFTIPAMGSHELKPGGDHIMLMEVTTPVKPGDEVVFTLTLKDGGTVSFTAIGKDFAGGNESYQPGQSASPMRMG